MKKLAVISHALPPITLGHAIVLYKLLESWNPQDYVLLTRSDFLPLRERGNFANSPEWLPARYYQFPADIKLKMPDWRLLSIGKSFINLFLAIVRRSVKTARIVKKEGCEAILACSGDIANIPAGFLASRLAGVDFHVYLFDDYTFQWTSNFYRWFATRAEKQIIHHATGVIVPNEFMCAVYHQRYGVQPVVIHNPTSTKQIPRREVETMGGKFDIVYTGSIYHAHYDAFRNLIKAIESIESLKINIHVYSAQTLQQLASEGIEEPIIFHDVVDNETIRLIQQNADVLFLPLAFKSEIPEIIRTSAPGKMGEYLASGRPILVHAPADSYISWYFRQHHCGLVVDQCDPISLAEAILQLASDEDLRKQITKNAMQRAHEDFEIELVSDKFQQIFTNRTFSRK